MRGRIRQWISDRRGVAGFVAGALVVGSLAGGGVAIAAIPSSTTSAYTGCAAKDNGALRVIDYQAGRRCKKTERRISWSKGWAYKGLWRATTSYRPGDVVLDNGSSYVARAASLAKPPVTDASRWGLLASAGAAGSTGPTGARGPSDAFVAPDGPLQPWGTSYTTQRSLALPPGSFVVTATGVANNNDSTSVLVDCRLSLGGVEVDLVDGIRLSANLTGGEASSFALNGAGTLAAPGTAALQCKGGTAQGNVVAPSIVAIHVGTLTTP